MGFEEDWGGGGPDPHEPAAAGAPTGAMGDTSTGKHALLLVPDFADAASTPGTRPMNSYLRLGAFHSDAANTKRVDLGEDLAGIVHGFTDDTRVREVGTEHALLESNANPPNGSPTALDSQDARRKESALIHKKGGWRDHSDGNRITTTRGDKVEVIRGNYKLIVLGRTDVPAKPTDGWDNAAGMEIAGGNVDASGADLAFGMLPDVMTPLKPDGKLPDPSDDSRKDPPLALETSYVWTNNLDGTWGWQQTTNVGSPDGPNNGQIISNTWVAYQETNLGSQAEPVQNIVSSTYGYSMTQTITLNPSFEGGQGIGPGNGSLTQWTNVEHLRTGVVANQSIDNTTFAVSISNAQAAVMGISNATAALTQLTSQAVAANAVVNLFGIGVELDAAVMLAQLILAVSSNTAWVGTVNDSHLALHNDLHAGIHMDHHALMHFDIHDGVHASLDLNPISITETGSLTMGAGKELKVIGQGPVIKSYTEGKVVASAGSVIEAANTFIKL